MIIEVFMKWERKRKKIRYQERTCSEMSPVEREAHIRRQNEKKWNEKDR